MAFKRSNGGYYETPTTVPASTNPTIALPVLRFVGEMMMIVTIASVGATSVVAGPAGWTQIINAGTNVKIGVFIRLVDGTETQPSITWSGLTTGTAGSPVIATMYNIAGLLQNQASVLDVAGAPLEQVASSTVQAGGAAITTVTANAVVFLIAARLDDDIIGGMDSPPATEFPWTRLGFEWTTSGTDNGFEVYWGTKATPGVVAQKTLSMTGASSDASTGVMFALKPGPPIYSPYMSIL